MEKLKQEIETRFGDAVELHQLASDQAQIRYPTISFKWQIHYFRGLISNTPITQDYINVPLRVVIPQRIIPMIDNFIKLMEARDGPTHCPVIVALQTSNGYCRFAMFSFSDNGSMIAV